MAQVDEDVKLLSDSNQRGLFSNSVDHLQYPHVDTFRCVSGQRFLRYDVGLEANELESEL